MMGPWCHVGSAVERAVRQKSGSKNFILDFVKESAVSFPIFRLEAATGSCAPRIATDVRSLRLLECDGGV